MADVVGATVVDNDDRVDADVVVDNAVLVDADAVAAATHTATQTLHASWSTLLAPPLLTMTSLSMLTLSLTMRCLSTPTLWPPVRRTRRGNSCTRREARCRRRRC